MKIKVKAKPNSGEQSIDKKEDFYSVKLKSSPENNKANLELIKFLEKYFKKRVKIKSGFKSPKKVVEVFG
ncbi:MAG: DUF167 domain-containing protein [Nanoarchaeota archaeon]|nr:DUF167 domain-containing protein [Nanoarchaeota archaeon]